MTFRSGKRLRATNIAAKSELTDPVGACRRSMAPYRTLVDVLEPRLLFSADHPLGLPVSSADFQEFYRQVDDAEVAALSLDMVHVMDHENSDNTGSSTVDQGKNEASSEAVKSSVARISDVQREVIIDEYVFEYRVDSRPMLADDPPALNVIYVTTTNDIVDADNFSSFVAFNNGAGGDNEVSLREAVIVANADPDVDLISLPDGIFSLTLDAPTIDDDASQYGDLDLVGDFEIQGSAENNTAIKQTFTDLRVFDLHSGAVTISDLTIEDGSTEAGENGAGILIHSGASAVFENVSFINNDAAADNGGAIYAAGDATLNNVTITGGTAIRGAGIYSEATATVVVRDSTISNNTVEDLLGASGGGLYALGPLEVYDSLFQSNAAHSGPDASSGPVDSDTRGGAIYVASSSITVIENSVFSNNSARSDGGAIHNNGTLTLTGTSLNFNSVGRWGGGLSSLGDVTVVDSTIWANSTNGPVGHLPSGGGIHIFEGGTLDMRNSIVSQNTSITYTGGIHLEGIATITGSTIVNNTSSRDNDNEGRGGISTDIKGGGNVLVLTDSLVADNFAGTDEDDFFAANGNDVESGGGNLIEFETDFDTQPSDSIGVDPGIASIQLVNNRAQITYVDAPVISSNGGGNTAALFVATNQPIVTTVIAVSGAGNSHAFSVGGPDAGAFTIDGTTGVLTFSTTPDPVTKDKYTVDVIATDSATSYLTDTQMLSITVYEANVAPTITSGGGGAIASVSADENQTTVTTVVATDADVGSTLTYSHGGTDASAFTIDSATGVLTFNTAPDHELKSSYEIDVIVTDSGAGSLTDTQTLTITVNDVNEAPEITSNGGSATAPISVDENVTAVTTVVASDVDDGDTQSYSLGGADAAAFTIDSATGVLSFNTAPDHELKSSYEIDVIVTDTGSLTDTQTLTITVNDVNEAPVITSNGGGAAEAVTVDENQTSVTTVVATDTDDSDTQSYSLGGTDAAAFTIDSATGVLTFNTAPDHELKSSYEIDVIVTDTGSLTDTQTLTITVNDVNEAPVITSNGGGAAEAVTVDENQTTVTTVVATDTDDSDTQSYSLGGTDAAAFTIDSATGVLTFNTAPDHELKSSYEIDVIVTDTGSLTDTQTLTITVNDVNEAPVITSNGGGAAEAVTVDENQTTVTTVVATDADDSDTQSYSLGGTDAAAFTIDSATGVLSFNTAPDHELKSSYEVDVIVTDTGSLTDTQTLTITVNDVNEAPEITSNGGSATAPISVDENQTTVTTVVATDTDDSDTQSYSLGGTDAAAFTIDSATGVLSFNTAPNHELKSSYEIDVIVTDSGAGSLTDTQTLTITVNDVNEAPEIASNGGSATAPISVDENQTTVTTVVTTDVDDSDTQSYSLGGTDAAAFTIDSATGVLTFNAAPDHELKSSYEVDVIVTDGGSLTDTQTLTVTVNDVNEAPVITSNGGGAVEAVTVDENQTTVTTVVASDVDDSDTQSYSLGGTDAAAFTIDSATGVLTFNTAPNHELKSSYEIDVIVTDTGSLTDTQTLTITVNDVNEAPEITSNGGSATAPISVDENQTTVTTVVATDTDDSDTQSYSLGGTDAAAFTIDSATGVLSFNTAPDHELKSSYEIDVIVTDTGSLTDTQTLTITVNDVNEAPVITSNGGGAVEAVTVDENQTTVTTVVATDTDDSDTQSYSLGGTDAVAFTIDSATGVLSFNTAPDHELKSSYEVDVIVTDTGSLTDTQTLTITVNDVNEAPKITSNGGSATAPISVDENQTTVTTVVATDIDDSDTQSYSLGGTDAAAFTIDSATGVLSFNTAPDHELKSSYEIDVIVTDSGTGSLTDTQTLTITVNDLNEAPVITSLGGEATAAVSVDENQRVITTVTSTDVDGDTRTYSLAGIDAHVFNIDTVSGVLSFDPATDPQSLDEYVVDVIVTDNGSGFLTDAQTLTISVDDINFHPVITSNFGGDAAEITLNENQLVVTTVTSIDADGDLQSYSLTGSDVSAFSIDSTSGVVRFNQAPNFESKNIYTIDVMVTDNGAGALTDSQTLNILVNDINEPPVMVIDGVELTSSISVNENQLDVVSVGVNDEDRQDTHVFSISGGVDQLSFSINSISGELTFIDTPDYETKDEYLVEITVTDSAGLTDEKSLAVRIDDINESPIITNHGGEALAFLSIEENQIQVARISASDVDKDDIQEYSIVGGADADSFVIDPIDGSLRFKVAPDFELPGDNDLNNVYEVVVQVSDANGGMDTQNMKITLLDSAEEPTVLAASPRPDSESSLPLFGFDRVSSGVELILPSKKTAISPIAEFETSQPAKVFEEIIETDAEATIANLFGNDLSEVMDRSDIQRNQWAVLSDTILTEYLAGQRVGWDNDDGTDYRVDIFDDSINIANLFAMLQQNDSEMFAALSDNSDKQREQIEKRIAESRTFMGSAITTTSGLSIGYFLYLIRGGAIMSSMLTSLPAWRFVDPLPILGSLEGSLNADQESLQSIVDDSYNAALNDSGR